MPEFKNIGLHLPWGELIVTLGLIYLILQSSKFASEGLLKEAALLNSASTALMLFLIVGTLILIMAIVGILQGRTAIAVGPHATLVQSIGFIIGLVSWSIIVLPPFSMPAAFAIIPSEFSVFAAAGQVIPAFWNYFIVNIAAPIAEELFFLVGLPTFIFILLTFLAKISGFGHLQKWYVSIPITILIVAPIFANTHVAYQKIAVLIMACIIFRSILIGLVYSDVWQNAIPFAELTTMFAIGIHIANNVGVAGGWGVFIQTMLFGAPDAFAQIVGLLVLLFMAFPFLVIFLNLKHIKIPFIS